MSGDKTHQQQRQIIEGRVDTSNADKDFDPRPYLNASKEVRERVHAYFIHIDLVALSESMVSVPAEDRPEHPGPRPAVEGAERRAEGPEDHHSLEPDVDDAGALGPQAAQARERDRHGEGDRRRDRAGGQHVLDTGERPDRRQHDDQGEDRRGHGPHGQGAGAGAPSGALRRRAVGRPRRGGAHAVAPAFVGAGWSGSWRATSACSRRRSRRRTIS